MRTALVTSTYLVGLDNNGKGTRLFRTQKWVDWYCKHPFLRFDRAYLFDNGSGESLRNEIDLGKHAQFWDQNYNYEHPWSHLPRRSNENFLHQYRAFYAVKRLFLTYAKIVWLDDDCYILSWKMADWINNMEDGWRTVWCPRHNFPMFSIDVICKDQFKAYEEFFPGDDYTKMNIPQSIETRVPFTHVHKEFVADRYGEYDPVPSQTPEMDLYSQCPIDMPMTFDMRKENALFKDNKLVGYSQAGKAAHC